MGEEEEEAECRICFQSKISVGQEEPENLRSEELARMLTFPCSCKGSMSHVHELCLVKWLLQKNIRHCELCKRQFVIKEELGSVWEIAKELLSQTFRTKKRIFSGLFYLVYLYFFSKRFYVSTKYFARHLIKGLIGVGKTYLQLAKAEATFIYRLLTLPWQTRKLDAFLAAQKTWATNVALAFVPSWVTALHKYPTIISRLLFCIGLLKDTLLYIYNCLMFKQLLKMGISEGLRLKRMLSRTVNKTRKLRVADSNNQDIVVDQPQQAGPLAGQRLNNDNNQVAVDLLEIRIERLETENSSFDSADEDPY